MYTKTRKSVLQVERGEISCYLWKQILMSKQNYSPTNIHVNFKQNVLI